MGARRLSDACIKVPAHYMLFQEKGMWGVGSATPCGAVMEWLLTLRGFSSLFCVMTSETNSVSAQIGLMSNIWQDIMIWSIVISSEHLLIVHIIDLIIPLTGLITRLRVHSHASGNVRLYFEWNANISFLTCLQWQCQHGGVGLIRYYTKFTVFVLAMLSC